MCDVPGITVFCDASVERFPGMSSRFLFKISVVARNISGTIIHFMLHIRWISIRKLWYFSFSFLLRDIPVRWCCHVHQYACFPLFLFLIIILGLFAISSLSVCSSQFQNKSNFGDTDKPGDRARITDPPQGPVFMCQRLDSSRLNIFAPECGLLKTDGRKMWRQWFSLWFYTSLFVLPFCWNVKQVHLKSEVSMNTANTRRRPVLFDVFLSVLWWDFSRIIRVQAFSALVACTFTYTLPEH